MAQRHLSHVTATSRGAGRSHQGRERGIRKTSLVRFLTPNESFFSLATHEYVRQLYHQDIDGHHLEAQNLAHSLFLESKRVVL